MCFQHILFQWDLELGWFETIIWRVHYLHFGLFVCLLDNWKSCERILMKFRWRGRARPRDQWVHFWWRSGSPSGSRSPKSAFTGLSKKLPMDFDEILWIAGVWPRDQLITFWQWSASPSGSGSPFRITIQFREEVPQFYYAGVRRRSVLPEYF